MPTEFWDSQGKKTIKTYQLLQFLEEKGFRVFKEGKLGDSNDGTDEVLVRNDEGILDFYNIQETRRIILNFLKSQNSSFSKTEDYEKVFEHALKENIKPVCNNLSLLPDGFKFFHDEKDAGFLLFKNGVVEVTKDEIKAIEYKDILDKGAVWRKQVLRKEIKLLSDDEWENGEKLDWEVFTERVCSYPVRNDENEITGWELDETRLNLLKLAGGYLIHTFKDPRETKAIILIDSTGVESDRQEGGSGKSLFLSSIENIRALRTIDGKTVDFSGSGSRFVYSEVRRDDQVILFDDVRQNCDFEMLFGAITKDLKIEGKGTNKISIPFKESPKICIATNHAVGSRRSAGNAQDRRQFVFEISSYFTERGDDNNPINDIKIVFNDRRLLSDEDWDEKQWNRFYNWWVRALQVWLKERHLPDIKQLEALGISQDNNRMKLLMNEIGDRDEAFWYGKMIEEFFPKLDPSELTISDLMDEYKKEFEVEVTPDLKKRVKSNFEYAVGVFGHRLKKSKGQNRYVKPVSGKSAEFIHIIYGKN